MIITNIEKRFINIDIYIKIISFYEIKFIFKNIVNEDNKKSFQLNEKFENEKLENDMRYLFLRNFVILNNIKKIIEKNIFFILNFRYQF